MDVDSDIGREFMIKSALSLLVVALCVGPAMADPSTTAETPKTTPIPSAADTPKEAPKPDPSVASKVNAILDAHHFIPMWEDWVKVAGDAAGLSVLVKVAKDGKELLIRRQRALSGLSYFPTPETIATAEALLVNTQLSHRIRGSAARAFARLKGVEAVASLTGFLTAPNARFREAVIKALGTIKDPTAIAALKAHLPAEVKPYLRDQIRSLTQQTVATPKTEEGGQP
jgi:hypothetical protein